MKGVNKFSKKLMLESVATGEKFPYTETRFPKKKLQEKEIEK